MSAEREHIYMMISYWGKEPKFSPISETEYDYWMNAPLPAGYSVKKILAPVQSQDLKGETL